jgi:hypothetical protein
VVLLVLALVVLLGAAAMVIDVGSWFKAKRDAQSVADATALGSVQDLPASPAAAASEISRIRLDNGYTGTVTGSLSSTYGPNDTITTEATSTQPSFFAQVFGIHKAGVGARATAVIASYTGFGANVMPWAVLQSDVTNSSHWVTPFSLKSGGGAKLNSGEFGSIDLNLWSGGSCGLGSGASDYRDTISGANTECQIKVGDVISTESGAMNGPTTQGLTDRTVNGQHVISPLDPSTLLTTNPITGDPELITVNHPNVVLVPVIPSWPGGKKPVTVVDLVWFLITSYSGSTVTGVFVHSAVAPSSLTCHQPGGTSNCGLGQYDPTGGADSGTRVILLTK